VERKETRRRQDLGTMLEGTTIETQMQSPTNRQSANHGNRHPRDGPLRPSQIIVSVASTKKRSLVCNDLYKMRLKTNYQNFMLLCMSNVLHVVVCE
jgi:hypothetical protein